MDTRARSGADAEGIGMKAIRRHHNERLRQRWRHIMRHIWRSPELADDPRWVNRRVATRKTCSCFMCSHFRETGGLTPQERRAAQAMKERDDS